MVFFINIIGYIALSIVIASYLDKELVVIQPISIAILLLNLLVLATFRVLSFITFVLLIYFIILLYLIYKKKIKIEFITSKVLSVSFISLIISLVLIYFFARDRIPYAWDELGAWALEVKTLYFNNGFSQPYMHTTIGYGDYLPGQMLFEWWFVNFDNKSFNEGLMYVGYYAFYIINLSHFFIIEQNDKHSIFKWMFGIVKCLAITLVLLYIPSLISGNVYEMLQVEFLQTCIIANVLIFINNCNETHNNKFGTIYWFSNMFVLLLLKDSSIVFIVILTLFYIISSHIKKEKRIIKNKYLLFSLMINAIVYTLWKVFCGINHRGTSYSRVTNILDRIKILIMNTDSDANKYIHSFFNSLIYQPIRGNLKYSINLVFPIFIILLVVFLILVYRNQTIQTKLKLVLCYVFMIAIYLLVILAMHIFSFRETQYFDPRVMMLSISRYGEPLLLGILIFIFYEFIRSNNYVFNLFFLLIVLLSGSITTVHYGFIGYRKGLNELINYRSNFEYKYEKLINDINTFTNGKKQCRIFFVYDDEVQNSRLYQYYLAPTAIYMHKSFSGIDSLILNYKNDNKCEYVYFDSLKDSKFNVKEKQLYEIKDLKD